MKGPIGDVGKSTQGWEDEQIVRRNGVKCISVLAGVKRGHNESNAFNNVKDLTEKKIRPVLNEDVTIEYGGTIESDNEIVLPIIKALSVSLIIILIFMIINFKKIKLSLIAIGSVLLCVPGGSLGLLLFNTDFSVTCILGIISLLEIIVRNAILIFDHAENLQLKEGFTAKEAAYDAGKRRMLPIFLTSATTAVGVVPMILSNSSLWTPMGIVICTGTIISMVLVVTILPVLYWKVYGNKQPKRKQLR